MPTWGGRLISKRGPRGKGGAAAAARMLNCRGLEDLYRKGGARGRARASRNNLFYL